MFLVWGSPRLKVHDFSTFSNRFHKDPGEWAVVASETPSGGEAGGQRRVAARGGEGARRPPELPFAWVALEPLWFPLFS